ncbi:MAG: DUF362 domain-containing protein [Bacteroidales bacterium]|nr:DUF362 domain-containing protein [Bacteroidales bacterium]
MKTSDKQLLVGRRSALKMLGFGSAAMLAGGFTDILAVEPKDMKPAPKPLLTSGNSSVAFTTGTDRQQMLYEVIKPFEAEIRNGLKGKQLILKVNMVRTDVPLCATHVDALRALLEYMKPIYKGQIIIAESSSVVDSAEGFKNYGYLDLAKNYNVKFVDLNTTSGTPFFIIDRDLHQEKIQVADTYVDPNNYIISISRLKTHNAVVMTAGVKNIVMGAPLVKTDRNAGGHYKSRMHSGGSRFLHYNMFLLGQHVRPDFTIIDGVEGMEGDGPSGGTPVDHRIALAGEDVVAVDSMCSRLMGIPLEDVGYLNYLAAAGLGNVDREKIDIIGSADPDKHIIKYKLHRNIENQLQWKDPLNPQSGATPGNPPAQQPR